MRPVSRGRSRKLLCRRHCNRWSHDRSRARRRRVSDGRSTVQQLGHRRGMAPFAMAEGVSERRHVMQVTSCLRPMSGLGSACRNHDMRRCHGAVRGRRSRSYGRGHVQRGHRRYVHSGRRDVKVELRVLRLKPHRGKRSHQCRALTGRKRSIMVTMGRMVVVRRGERMRRRGLRVCAQCLRVWTTACCADASGARVRLIVPVDVSPS